MTHRASESLPGVSRSCWGVSLGIALGLAACSSSSSLASGSSVPRVASTRVMIESASQTNSGNVLSMMIRSVPEKVADTTSETYEEAARMLANPRDDAVVLAQAIFPGRPTLVHLAQPPDKRLILYFFFTSPGDYWRVQIGGAPPAEVHVELGENQVERYRVRR